MENKLRKIKDSTIYYVYEKLYNKYIENKYDKKVQFINDLPSLFDINDNSDSSIIINSLIKYYNDENQSDYLTSKELEFHSTLLIMISNDNFNYLLDNINEKDFKSVFGTKTLFNASSKLIDIIGIKNLKDVIQNK